MTPPALSSTLLELHVPNFHPVKKYYGALGFNIVWERTPDGPKGYLVMKMDTNILCFWPGTQTAYDQLYFSKFPKDTPRGYGVEIVIVVDNIEVFYDKVKHTANVVEPLAMQPWGLKDFRGVDPFGYYLRFTDKHNILDRGNAIP